MDTRFYRSHLKHHGVFKTALRAFNRSIGRVFTYKILYCVKLDLNALEIRISRAADKLPLIRLKPAALLRMNHLQEYEMSERFLNAAQHKDDMCFGIMRDGRIASYSWFSNKPTLLFKGDWEIKFNSQCLYAYKAFTHPDFRGQRLAAFVMSGALRELSRQGYGCLVGIVEADNFSMMKSLVRSGWETTGKFICIRLFGIGRVFSTGKSRDVGFHLHAAKAVTKN